MFTTKSASPKVPATDPALGRAALVLCCHGIRGGPGSAARHAAAIRRLRVFGETQACCLKGRPSLAEAVEGLRSPVIYLVPMLMAEGYTARQLLGRAIAEAPRESRRIVPCRPVGANPRIVEVLSATAKRSCRAQGWAPGETTVIVMGHGTRRCTGSGATALRHAEMLRQGGDFAGAAAAFLDQSPGLEQALRRSRTRHNVVVGLFADRGAHGEDDVPRMLAQLRSAAVYAGPLGTAPELADLVLEQVAAVRAEAA